MTNLFLPQKQDFEVQYSLDTPGTYTWVAPDAENAGGGDQYEILLQLWSAGAGGSGGTRVYTGPGGGGGGGGCWTLAAVKVLAGTSYTFVVGEGGNGAAAFTYAVSVYSSAGAGVSGGFSRISDGSGAIITAGGGQVSPATTSGYGGGLTDRVIGGSGGTVSIGQASKVSYYYSITGGAGANGGQANTVFAPNIAPAFSEPGGLGGRCGGGASNKDSGGGGGASPRNNGGNGGTTFNTFASKAGGGGGAGYFIFPAGSTSETSLRDGGNASTGGSSGNLSEYVGNGGKGGHGRISFSFVVKNGGDPGSAPA